ncbi:precorrin-2 C(20)-methyltransferase [Deferrisoma camini]|uniref:precorrin-2 C(20)-methyltransferase n=1 Tax=Deferrisoma camini TaxID=1035120 RepID=UPI00046CA7F4|nr:precorrin-2 C(20)-methyltransferase [Deferrisoma camini]
MTQLGTFYGIGVGPGDPELLTVKAVRVLQEVDVVFAAGHERSGRSAALEIARPHLRPGCPVVTLPFRHTFEDVRSREVHRDHARRVVDELRRPAAAAFLTLGDPMTYSTFTYLLEAVRELEPRVPVEVVPGITSFAAAAAEARVPLVEGDQTLAVVSAARGTAAVERALEAADSLAILKPYRNTAEVCDLLEARGLGGKVVFASHCTRPGALVARGVCQARTHANGYMSLFLVRPGEDRTP